MGCAFSSSSSSSSSSVSNSLRRSISSRSNISKSTSIAILQKQYSQNSGGCDSLAQSEQGYSTGRPSQANADHIGLHLSTSSRQKHGAAYSVSGNPYSYQRLLAACVSLHPELVTHVEVCKHNGGDYIWSISKSLLRWVELVLAAKVRTNDPRFIKLGLLICRVASSLQGLSLDNLSRVNRCSNSIDDLLRAVTESEELLGDACFHAHASLTRLLEWNDTLCWSGDHDPLNPVPASTNLLEKQGMSAKLDMADKSIRAAMHEIFIAFAGYTCAADDRLEGGRHGSPHSPQPPELLKWWVSPACADEDLECYAAVELAYLKGKVCQLHQICVDRGYASSDSLDDGTVLGLRAARWLVDAGQFELLCSILGYNGSDVMHVLHTHGVRVPSHHVPAMKHIKIMPIRMYPHDNLKWLSPPAKKDCPKSSKIGIVQKLGHNAPKCMAIGIDSKEVTPEVMSHHLHTLAVQCKHKATVHVLGKGKDGQVMNVCLCKGHKDWATHMKPTGPLRRAVIEDRSTSSRACKSHKSSSSSSLGHGASFPPLGKGRDVLPTAEPSPASLPFLERIPEVMSDSEGSGDDAGSSQTGFERCPPRRTVEKVGAAALPVASKVATARGHCTSSSLAEASKVATARGHCTSSSLAEASKVATARGHSTSSSLAEASKAAKPLLHASKGVTPAACKVATAGGNCTSASLAADANPASASGLRTSASLASNAAKPLLHSRTQSCTHLAAAPTHPLDTRTLSCTHLAAAAPPPRALSEGRRSEEGTPSVLHVSPLSSKHLTRRASVSCSVTPPDGTLSPHPGQASRLGNKSWDKPLMRMGIAAASDTHLQSRLSSSGGLNTKLSSSSEPHSQQVPCLLGHGQVGMQTGLRRESGGAVLLKPRSRRSSTDLLRSVLEHSLVAS